MGFDSKCGFTSRSKSCFCDINLDTFNIDSNQLKSKITPKTKVIIAVHLFGYCADMDAIKEIAGDIPIVEDAACAAGAAYKGVPAGALGIFGCFSFHHVNLLQQGKEE